MKYLSMMGALLLIALMSCSQQDGVWNPDDGENPSTPETHSVKVKVTKADEAAFADVDIKELCVFAYLSDSLVYADTSYPILDELYVNKAVKSAGDLYQVTETNF